jgi:hypothetical protein
MRVRRFAPIAVALIIGGVLAGQALAGRPRTRHQTVVSIGAVLSRNGSTAVSAYKITSSLYGHGAGVQVAKITGTTFPLTGTDTVTAYYTDGAAVTKDKFTLDALNANGVGIVSGTGKCAGGTGIHKHEICSYKLSGTFNSKTMVSQVTAKGTDTR